MELTTDIVNEKRADLKREHAEIWRRLTMSYEYGRIREIEAQLRLIEDLAGPDATPDTYAPPSEKPPTEAGY